LKKKTQQLFIKLTYKSGAQNMRIILLTILLFSNIISYSQSKSQANAVLKMNGIIYFEKEQDIYTMYFIETTCSDLMYLLNTKDTIEIFSIGSPGDNANDTRGFKSHLNKTIKFKTSSFLVSQENYQGLLYEDSVQAYSSNGYIEYVKGRRYNLAPEYKKVKLNTKETVLITREYILINSFIGKGFLNQTKNE
jgi:hypothetical protein